MRRGVVYETPWDDTNRQTNRLYLQELLEMADSTFNDILSCH
jgi:hypothetical protein